ncbi:hypothetical protein [Flavivirga sp. 57AJ16]|uniref:capsular polysaccharide export protein, LipB/KpsS family n=1 Tax=Flavivirga sp. 57AJ16 TaxID=3025307 RepID=UPI0023650301|nr:hypothetical protein [Flavivirga sp. 57AJ16]MDD7885335.1 hypothetical protein [Flavivirga sp. 57AJ16]
MKIICISALDKFSRFFLKLGEVLNSNSPTKLYIYSLHFSGFLYPFIRLKFSSWISIKSWFFAIKNKKRYVQIIKNETTYKGINFKKIIKYHSNLNKSTSVQNLLLQALAYIDIFELTILKKSPDIIILTGDSKLSIEACTALAKKHHIKTYFIEQGPFNTTIFDSEGVNANCSIRKFKLKNGITLTKRQKNDVYNFIDRPIPLKYKRSPIYRGLDFTLHVLLNKSYLYPPDLKFIDTFPSFNFSKTSKTNFMIKTDKNIKICLLILQVPMDVNMIYHSPYFKSHLSIVKTIHKNLPENSRLILREHPVYKGKYEEELYEYSKNHNISFDTITSLKNSLKLADIIIVNNSTVGIEAIAMKKSVVVLGNSYYDNPKICTKYNQQGNLKQILSNALDFIPKNKNIDAFLYEFIFNHLIPGFISDKELIAAKIISEKISNKIN